MAGAPGSADATDDEAALDALSDVVFWPQKHGPVVFAPESRVERVEICCERSGLPVVAYARRPSTRRPPPSAAVVFHGNGELALHYCGVWPPSPGLASALYSLGLAVLWAEYPGYGESAGAPALSALLDCAASVARAAPRVLGVDGAGSVVLVGRSLGAVAALHAAHAGLPGAGALVLDSGVCSLARVPAWRARMDAGALAADARLVCGERKAAGFAGPALLIHNADDAVVPLDDNAGRIQRARDAAGLRTDLVRLPGGGHNHVAGLHHEAYSAALGAFLAEHGLAQAGQHKERKRSCGVL
eukprot:m51a1_g10539 hypothetical protein (301) ;mRNA; r:6066-6968